jgi:SAM-dependent methyltransferase
MGLNINATKFLVKARKSGARFDRTLTLGRQHMLVSPERIEAILKEAGAWPPSQGEAAFRAALRASSWRFETVARALGAQQADSLDASTYEGATLIHDLNQPIPDEYVEQFDAIIDGGTLEHVFHFPVAIANCMKMLKVGGHLFLLTPANNYFGHGFYQFSPELFFRIFSRENGFEVTRMVAVVEGLGTSSVFGVKYPFTITSPLYSVQDPAEIKRRVELINDKPVMLMVSAKRISRENIFARTPQQSDYVPQWQEGPNQNPMGQSKGGLRIFTWLRSNLSETFCRETLPKLALFLDPFRLRRFRRQFSFRNKECYVREKD